MNATFVMLAPDAVVGGYVELVLERVQAHGLRTGACRLFRLDYERLGRMYAHRDQAPVYGGQRTSLPPAVMSPLYAQAPAAVVVLDQEGGDACAAMLKCKGATRPEAAAPGTIRIAGENYVFNLVHCPDSRADAEIELRYLVGAADAEALWAISAGREPAMMNLAGVEQLRLCLPAFSGWETLSFPATANRIRCRVVQKLAGLARADREATGRLATIHAALENERSRLLAAGSVVERWRIGVEVDSAVRDDLAGAAVRDPRIGAGLAALSALYDVDGKRDVDSIRQMDACGIYLSPVEAVALDGHAYTCWRENG